MPKVRITDETMRAIRGEAIYEFRQTGERQGDGTWRPPRLRGQDFHPRLKRSKTMNEPSYTVDEDTDRRAWDPPKWKVTKRDADGMPVDEYGPYDSKAKAARSAANRRYSAKTRRPVQPR